MAIRTYTFAGLTCGEAERCAIARYREETGNLGLVVKAERSQPGTPWHIDVALYQKAHRTRRVVA